MQKILPALFILFLIHFTVSGQNNAFVYPDIENFKSEHPIEEPVIITPHTILPEWCDWDFEIEPASKDVKKSVISRASLIQKNDTLYINCKIIAYKRFAPVLYKSKNYLYFRGFMSRLKEHEMQMHISGKKTIERGSMSSQSQDVGAVVAGGAGAGALVMMNRHMKLASQRYNYLVHIPSGQVKVIDISLMQELLENKPKLASQYMKEGHPEDAPSIIRFLTGAFEK